MTAAPSLGDLDEFRLLRPLGRGGMGAVYLAHDTLLDRPVAVKVVKAAGVDVDARRRFLTEARALARLSHPNVVTVYRAGVTIAGQPYLAQELVRGVSLDRTPLPLPLPRALAVGLGIARGLAAAHRRGVLHRDVKPANVMLDEHGTPRVLDFGLATIDGAAAVTGPPPADDDVAITADAPGAPAARDDAAIAGTPRYLAPEGWLGAPATVATDLYALGALLYELVTGGPPYPARERAALRAEVVDGPPAPPIDARAPAAPPALVELVAALLARDPGARPASADEVVHRLERIVSGAPPLPTGNPYPGLAPFDAAQQADFYGRGADVAAIVDRLRTAPLVVVTGDSGTGKSSLVRAGVAPAIVGGALDDGRAWRVVVVRLGRTPLAALAQACGVPDATFADPTPSRLAAALGDGRAHGRLLVVDQLEELITVTPPVQVGPAAAALAALVGGIPGVRVIATLRGDFFTRLVGVEPLGRLIADGVAVLAPLDRAGVRDAVVEPARARGVRFESGGAPPTVEALVDAVVANPGALPLVQFALAELWQRRDRAAALIPRDALAELGGVAGALARHADRVLAALPAAARPAARRVLLALITRAGTRATGTRGELIGDGDAAAAAALEGLIAGRLVVATDQGGDEPVYQLAHDALITAWTTLAGWLDDAAGQRSRRARLAAAADDWHRHGRRPQHLWGAAQLADLGDLDELGARDAAFVAASRRAVRWRRIALAVVVLALPVAALATWRGVRFVDRRARDRRVAAHIAVADAAERAARDAAAAADAGRAAVPTLFAGGPTPDAERAWQATRAHAADARAWFADAATALEAALATGGDRPAVRRRLADVLAAAAAEAEAAYDAPTAAGLWARAAIYDAARAAARRRPATLTIDAPGARLAIAAVTPGRIATPASLTTSGQPVPLSAGDYDVLATAADGLVIHAPLVLAHGEVLRVALPRLRGADVPAGFAVIPPGRFLTGARGEEMFRTTFLGAAPLHPRTTPGYLIARDETTYAEWLAYLRSLPPAERELRRPRTASATPPAMRVDGDGPFTLVWTPGDRPLAAPEGSALEYPGRQRHRQVDWARLPVSGVSFDDAQAYVAWLAATGRVPRARICTELEWERAARGADGRSFPHGEALAPDDANFDETYGRVTDAFGPDPVGSHPASDSPFGLHDMAGNVKEWVLGVDGKPWLRGGGYYKMRTVQLTMNRDAAEPTMRLPWIGLRVCADLPPGS